MLLSMRNFDKILKRSIKSLGVWIHDSNMLGSSFSLWYAVFSTKFHEIRNQNFTVTLVTSKSIYRLRVNNFCECVFAEVLKKAHRVIQHTVVNNVTFFPIIFSKKMNCAWRSSRFVNKNIVTTQWHVCRRFD